MFGTLFKESQIKKTARKAYEDIVSQARQEEFYKSYMIPDSLEGRFEMIVLHLFVFVQRLKAENLQKDELGKLVLEEFFSELDGSLREMGIGDLSVPKKVKKLADSFYLRVYTYSEALESGDAGKLATVLQEQVYSQFDITSQNGDTGNISKALAEYVAKSYESICSVPLKDFVSGEIRFVQPEIAN